MTPEQYSVCLGILGISWRQSYRYATGERPLPPALGIALALMVKYQLFVEQAQDIVETV